MPLLHLHTQLLELMDWDEEATEEAMQRAVEISRELSNDGINISTSILKKRLELEYSDEVVVALVQFFEAASIFESQLIEDNGDIQ
jgi:hypothetical protein